MCGLYSFFSMAVLAVKAARQQSRIARIQDRNNKKQVKFDNRMENKRVAREGRQLRTKEGRGNKIASQVVGEVGATARTGLNNAAGIIKAAKNPF